MIPGLVRNLSVVVCCPEMLAPYSHISSAISSPRVPRMPPSRLRVRPAGVLGTPTSSPTRHQHRIYMPGIPRHPTSPPAHSRQYVFPTLSPLPCVLPSQVQTASPSAHSQSHLATFSSDFTTTPFGRPMAVLFTYLPILVGVAIVIRLLMTGRRPKNYPPGPPTLPIIGNLHQVCYNTTFLSSPTGN